MGEICENKFIDQGASLKDAKLNEKGSVRVYRTSLDRKRIQRTRVGPQGSGTEYYLDSRHELDITPSSG
jgi:hypothetical protein